VNERIFDVDAVPITKQVGVALEPGQLSCENDVKLGVVSRVQVTVWGLVAEMVADTITPPDELVPVAKHAGEVALVGHTIWDSEVTPPGRLFDHVLVDQVPGELACATAATAAPEP
jgi:hypothetical protein